MELVKLDINSWKNLTKGGNQISGYDAEFIFFNKSETDLLLFQDEKGFFHFVIKLSEVPKTSIVNPNVNGLNTSVNKYRIHSIEEVIFIDVVCNHKAYLREFTALVKEVGINICQGTEEKLITVNKIITSWIAFWGIQSGNLLSEESQLGLIGELFALKHFAGLNYQIALDSWKGPQGFVHDFVFDSYSIEIKTTLKGEHLHIINGLEQLTSLQEKDLYLLSIIASRNNTKGISLPEIIYDIANTYLANDPEYLSIFFNLLKSVGYNKIHETDYDIFKFEILSNKVFIVDEEFPKITNESFSYPIPKEVKQIRYTLDLNTVSSSIAFQDLMPL